MREQLRTQLETQIIQLVIGVAVIGVGGFGLTLTVGPARLFGTMADMRYTLLTYKSLTRMPKWER